jgi:Protein of unknown function with HXXEE motif
VSHRSRLFFLLLVVAQVAHSVEEYATRLYEVFAPARFVSGLFSDDVAVGFVIANIIITVGIWCYVGPVRSGRGAARSVAWVWAVIELANGIGHIILAVLAGGYFPGAMTAVVLVYAAGSLALNLRADSNGPPWTEDPGRQDGPRPFKPGTKEQGPGMRATSIRKRAS